MGNFIGYTGDTHSKAILFINDHAKEWPVIINKVRLGRRLKDNSYLKEANEIYAPIIEKAGFGFNGDIDVARELWKIIRETTNDYNDEKYL